MKLPTVRADYRMARVTLVGAHHSDERIDVRSAIGTAIPELSHVVRPLSRDPAAGGVTAQVFGLGRAREAIRAATSTTDLSPRYRPTKLLKPRRLIPFLLPNDASNPLRSNKRAVRCKRSDWLSAARCVPRRPCLGLVSGGPTVLAKVPDC